MLHLYRERASAAQVGVQVHRPIRTRRVPCQDDRNNATRPMPRLHGAVFQRGLQDSGGGRGRVQPRRHGARCRNGCRDPNRVRHQHVARLLLCPANSFVWRRIRCVLLFHLHGEPGVCDGCPCRTRMRSHGTRGPMALDAHAEAYRKRLASGGGIASPVGSGRIWACGEARGDNLKHEKNCY